MNKLLRILAILAVLFSFGKASAELVLEENFEYPVGVLPMEEGKWFTQWSNYSSLTIADGLTFEGYAGSAIGNGVDISVDDSDAAHRSFKEITSGDVYVAFMFRPFVAYKKGYFFCLRDNKITYSDFNYNGRVSVNDSGAIGLTFGDNKKAQYSAQALDGNKTYLVVLKYTIKEGAANDEVSLYCMDTFLAKEPATPDLGPLSDATKNDINPANVVLRGYASSDYIDLMVDGIRVATTWEDAVGASSSVEGINKTSNTVTSAEGKIVLNAVNKAGYRVFDLSGREIYRGTLDNGSVSLDAQKGIYIVRFGNLTSRVVVR